MVYRILKFTVTWSIDSKLLLAFIGTIKKKTKKTMVTRYKKIDYSLNIQ